MSEELAKAIEAVNSLSDSIGQMGRECDKLANAFANLEEALTFAERSEEEE